MAKSLDSEQVSSQRQSFQRHQNSLASRASQACSLLTALVSIFVLVCWSVHAYALLTLLPNLPAIAQSTAVVFLLASVSLGLQPKAATQKGLRRVAQIFALAVLLVGLLTLLNSGLLIIGHGRLQPTHTGYHINRMSPNTAINFVLLSLALLLADVRGHGDRWPAQVLTLIVALDALVAFVGQIYGVTFLYGLSPYVGMAFYTAALFLLMSIGLLLSRPDRGFVAVLLSNDAAGRAARRFLPLVLVAPVVLGGVGLLSLNIHRPDAPLLAYLLVVVSIGLLGWLVWSNVLALSAQVRLSHSYERQVADLERGRIEDALAVSEQRLLFAAESAGIGTWLWDIAADHLEWSGTCKALLGLSPHAEMTHALFFDHIHPDDRPNAEKTIARSLNEGSPYDIEYRVVWPDATEHWIAAKGRGYQDTFERPIRFEGTVQNIDARKAAEVTVRESAERQKALLRDVLASVTGGRLRLAETENDLPEPLPQADRIISLTPMEGLRALRQNVRETVLRLDFGDERCQDVVTAASESGMNAVTHGGGLGEAQVSTDGISTVQVRVRDWGSGINMESLPKAALSRGWSSTASLGHGLVMMLQSVDRLWLLTGSSGTTVVLEQDREEPPPAWL